MSARKGRAPDPRQSSFSFFVEPAAEKKDAPAEDFDADLREAVSATLDMATRRNLGTMPRDHVAEAMSKRLGRRVTKTQLDQWAAQSQDDRRIPVDALRALGMVTGDWRALHVLVEACGFKALTQKEALCAEFGALAAVRRRIDQQSRALSGGMDELVESLLTRMREQA